MNLQNLSLTRLFSRRKRSTGMQPERVKEAHIPASSLGLVPGPARKQDPAEEVLADMREAACKHSGAGMTAFVP